MSDISNTQSILDGILDEIMEKYEHDIYNTFYKVVYIGIGSAAHMARNINENYVIEPEFDQQYPMFLRMLKNKYKTADINIILIDPMMEEPPFICKNKDANKFKDTPLDNNFKRVSSIKYQNDKENITVYSIKECVHYITDEYANANDKSANIMDFFDKLNHLSICFKWFTVIQDYTGRSITNIAKHYDPILGPEINHIFYGVGARSVEGCYINLAKPVCYFALNDDKSYLEAFNPWLYDKTNFNELTKMFYSNKYKLDKLQKDNLKYFSNEIIICEQILMFFSRIYEIYKDIVSLYRRISTNNYNIKNGIVDRIELGRFETSYIKVNYCEEFDEIYKKDSFEAQQIIRKIFETELKNILNLWGANDKAYSLIQNIVDSEPNPYKWFTPVLNTTKSYEPSLEEIKEKI